jgi:hypothetical protein
LVSRQLTSEVKIVVVADRVDGLEVSSNIKLLHIVMQIRDSRMRFVVCAEDKRSFL